MMLLKHDENLNQIVGSPAGRTLRVPDAAQPPPRRPEIIPEVDVQFQPGHEEPVFFGPDDKPIVRKDGKLWQPDQAQMHEIQKRNPQEYSDIMALEQGSDAENQLQRLQPFDTRAEN